MRFGNEFGFYELNPFPGCNQLVVSNHAHIYPWFRGKGHGQKQHLERLAKARELGYNKIICTVNSENAAEIHILNKNHWTKHGDFVNKETGGLVEIWSRDL